MKKSERKYCKNRGKRIANWLNKSYPFSSYVKRNTENYSKLHYRWIAEERDTKLVVEIIQERSNIKLEIRRAGLPHFGGNTNRPYIIKTRNFNLLKEESFNQLKKEVRILEDYVYKSHRRHRRLKQILI